MNIDKKSISGLGIFAAIVFLVAMTPVGIIPIGYINATIMHIPVIIATLLMKRGKGSVIAFAYALAAMLAAFGMSFAQQTEFERVLYGRSVLATMAVTIIPCMVLPFVTMSVYKKMTRYFLKSSKNKRIDVVQRYWAIAIAAAAASLVTSIVHLVLFAVLFGAYGIWGNFVRICTLTQFAIMLCEAVVAALVAPTVVVTVKHIRGYEDGHVYEEDEYYYDRFDDDDLPTEDDTIYLADGVNDTEIDDIPREIERECDFDRFGEDESDADIPKAVESIAFDDIAADSIPVEEAQQVRRAIDETSPYSVAPVKEVQQVRRAIDETSPYSVAPVEHAEATSAPKVRNESYTAASKSVAIHTSFERDTSYDSAIDYFEGVQPQNVAIMPSTRSILPRLTKEQDFMRVRIEKYMKDGAYEITYNLLDVFRSKFNTTLTRYYVGLYAIMLCIENGQSEVAERRLVELLAESDAPALELGKNGTRIICGMISILCRGIVVNTLDNKKRDRLERMQMKATEYVKAGQYLLTSQVLAMIFDI